MPAFQTILNSHVLSLYGVAHKGVSPFPEEVCSHSLVRKRILREVFNTDRQFDDVTQGATVHAIHLDGLVVVVDVECVGMIASCVNGEFLALPASGERPA